MNVKLIRIPEGYAYKHYLIEPCVMDDSPRSKGHRAWNVSPDPLGRYPSRTYDRLYEVRDALAHADAREQAKAATVAWLLEPDGSTTAVTNVRRALWPTTAVVTLRDGSTKSVSILNLLDKDDLGRRWRPDRAKEPAS